MGLQDLGALAGSVAGRAIAAAALVVPLGFFSALATPFTGPKEAIFELAGALGLGALCVGFAAGPTSRPPAASPHRMVLWASLLVLAIIMLVAVLIPGLGTTVGGAKRWLRVPGVSIQPAEVAKVVKTKPKSLKPMTPA